jgi:CubicO group peptidase (beta-lactamase class C family)
MRSAIGALVFACLFDVGHVRHVGLVGPVGGLGCTRADVSEKTRAEARVPALAWARVTPSSTQAGASGHTDLERGERATVHSRFEAASIAKTIIAVVAMQLVEERRWSLDDELLRHPNGPVTVRHLLAHTGSIVDPPDADATGDLDAFVARHPPFFASERPGTVVRYSNYGTALVAQKIARLDGVPFAESARRRVFEPLAMTHTSFRGAPDAAPYLWDNGHFVRLSSPDHALYPVVDLFACVSDLGRFARAMLSGGELDGVRLLGADHVEEMMHGLGWQQRRFGDHDVVGHEGEDRGASTALFLDRARGRGIVVLANGDAFQGGRTEPLLQFMIRSLD